MAEAELLRLKRVEIDGLFGRYEHRFDLNHHDRVTILHGANGVGKTTTLHMIHALIRGDFPAIFDVPFAQTSLTFSDGSGMYLAKGEDDHPALVTLVDASGNTESISARPSTAQRLAAREKHLTPHPSLRNAWVDTRDGEILFEADVLERYGPWGRRLRPPEPSRIDEFLDKANTHFIDVARLIRPLAPSRSTTDVRTPHRRPQLPSVVECNHHFRSQLSDAMARYGREAQKRDQTFPERLFVGEESIPESQLRERLATLERKMAALKALGILGEERPVSFGPLRLDELDDTRSKAMALYVRDTEAKLATLDGFANRAQHFLNNLNQKYRHKALHLDRSEGLVAEGENGETVGLESLSSGEQHELVLHYELLFRVRTNTVVLIDEPELSLHINWQKQFLPDLLDTVQLSGIDAVIATHSPFIAGYRDDLMVRLGDPL